jgi:hypothetical protein
MAMDTMETCKTNNKKIKERWKVISDAGMLIKVHDLYYRKSNLNISCITFNQSPDRIYCIWESTSDLKDIRRRPSIIASKLT